MATNDIYTLIAAEVAKAELSELYVLAGKGFGFMHAPQEVHRITAQAQKDMQEDAHVVLAKHFHICEASDVLFGDGCGGVIDAGGVPVEFQVRQIGENPTTLRVLFSRVDAAKLLQLELAGSK